MKWEWEPSIITHFNVVGYYNWSKPGIVFNTLDFIPSILVTGNLESQRGLIKLGIL